MGVRLKGSWNRSEPTGYKIVRIAFEDVRPQRLVEPAIKTAAGPAWKEFPERLRTDIENYLGGLKRIRRTAKKRIRPCKDTTIKMRRASLAAAARTAVGEGVPIRELTSLKALLDPEIAGKIIEAYWMADGKEPSTYTIDLGSRFLSIARELGCFDEKALGHRNLQTTIKFYCGLETTQANIIFGALVRKLRKPESDPEDGDLQRNKSSHQ